MLISNMAMKIKKAWHIWHVVCSRHPRGDGYNFCRDLHFMMIPKNNHSLLTYNLRGRLTFIIFNSSFCWWNYWKLINLGTFGGWIFNIATNTYCYTFDGGPFIYFIATSQQLNIDMQQYSDIMTMMHGGSWDGIVSCIIIYVLS